MPAAEACLRPVLPAVGSAGVSKKAGAGHGSAQLSGEDVGAGWGLQARLVRPSPPRRLEVASCAASCIISHTHQLKMLSAGKAAKGDGGGQPNFLACPHASHLPIGAPPGAPHCHPALTPEHGGWGATSPTLHMVPIRVLVPQAPRAPRGPGPCPVLPVPSCSRVGMAASSRTFPPCCPIVLWREAAVALTRPGASGMPSLCPHPLCQ